MASKPKFERYGGNKVRTGCVTCKARRVKCDEAKPTCTRCSKAGRLCGGYAPTPPKNRNEAGQPLVIISYVAPESSISLLPGVGSREKRSLDFFRTRTVLETFPFADWPEHVLRTSCYEDAIRHAIVALGALHEHYQGMSQMDSGFAMLEYSKAMKQVMKLDMRGSASTDVALISCILFACFESLQGHYRSSLLHVNSGLQILKEQELSNVADTEVAYVSKEVLRPMFLRFVTQSREIGNKPYTGGKKAKVLITVISGDQDILLAYDTLPTIPQTPVSAFNSFEAAHSSMNVYLHEFILFLASLDLDLPRDLPRLQAITEQHTVLTKRHIAWGKAFDDLLERGPTATESDIAKLQVWRTLINIMLELNFARGEMAWDGKIDMFRKLVNFAEIVVEKQPRGRVVSSGTRTTTTQVSGPHMSRLNSKDQHQDPMDCDDTALSLSQVEYCQTVSSWKPVFSLDIGIVTPLYVVVSRCRDPAIRRRGLQLLASCNRREGIWDSTLTARVAERIIAIEENGAMSHPVLYASQIPEHARIRDLHTKFGVDRQGLIRYTKNVACGGPDDKWEELLEW